MGELTADQQNKMEEEFVNKFYEKASAFFLEIADKVDLTDISEKGYGGIYFVPKRQGLHADLFGINLVFNLAFKYNEKNAQQVDAIKRFLNFLNQTSYYHNLENIAFRAFHEVYVQDLKESKKTKVSDKMLFGSWRRYLGNKGNIL